MRSIQVARHGPEAAASHTELRVCKSQAGWFVGTLCIVGGVLSPGSRDTCYFASEDTAAFALNVMERMYARLLQQRELARERGGPDVDRSDRYFSSIFAVVLHACDIDPLLIGCRLDP